jgi:DNA repair protein RadC
VTNPPDRDRSSFTYEAALRDAVPAGPGGAVRRRLKYDRSLRITGAAEAAALLVPILGKLDVEEFHVLVLDTRHALKRRLMIARGTLDRVEVHPREIFISAIRLRGAGLILAHNHPSGVIEPSRDDEAMTERLVSAGEILGIPVLDHLVIGADGAYYSFSERGRITRKRPI